MAIAHYNSLDRFPTWIWIRDDGYTLVLGAPGDSYVFYTLQFPIDRLLAYPLYVLAVLFVDALILFCMYAVARRRAQRAVKPVTEALDALSRGQSAEVTLGGNLAEIGNRLTDVSRIIERKDSARALWIRSVSHDIRTPLTAIMGLSATVEENETLTDEGRSMVEEIHQNAQWLLHLSENILSVTRFCDEGVVIEKSDEVVEEIVGSAIRRFRKNCGTDIPITVSKPEEILLVPMDATLIEQVLLNLLENVAKHSPSATEIFIEIRKDARRVWLTVADNGDGIPPQLLGVLFDGYLPLGAVEASDRSRHMGIGLSVCRAIVRAHGGEIYARNKIDGGAEFRFWLPAEEESNT